MCITQSSAKIDRNFDFCDDRSVNPAKKVSAEF